MLGYNSNTLPARASTSSRRKSSFSPDKSHPKSSRKHNPKSSQLKERSMISEKEKSFSSALHPPKHKSKKSTIHKDIDKLEMLMNPPSENSVLKSEVNSLKNTVKKQNRALNDLCEKILEERKEVKELTERFIDSRKKESLITELKDRLEIKQNQEVALLRELREQQKNSEDLYARLKGLEGESKKEGEEARRYYKERYAKKYKEEIDGYKVKIEAYEREKEQLMVNLSKLERIHEMDTLNKSVAENEANSYKVQLEVKTRENDVMKEEIRRLKKQLEGVEEGRRDQKEMDELKAYVEELRAENEELREKGEESNREFQKVWQMENKRRENEKELELERKVEDLQKKMEGLEREVEKRDEQYASMETYYKERMETTARVQDQRRKEWSDIYNELLQEVRELKEGMEILEMQNQRLKSNGKLNMMDDY